jgi:hypothetical protein
VTSRSEAVLGQAVLDPRGLQRSDALGDHERLPQVRSGLSRAAGQQAPADSRQGAGLLGTRAERDVSPRRSGPNCSDQPRRLVEA